MDIRQDANGRAKLAAWASIFLLSAALAGAAIGASQGKLKDDEEGAVSRLRPLVVASHQLRKEPGYIRRRAFVGQIEASRESEIGFELDGKIARIAVDEGDRVLRGQTLATLDIARLEARRAELEAARLEIAARRKLAQITRDRTQGLVGEGAASQQKLDDDRETVRALRGAEQLAEAKLASNALEIEKSTLVAPYNGVVTQRFVDEGRVLESGTPVLRLMETSAFEARIGVAGAAVTRLEEGQVHPLEISDIVATGYIKAILPVRASRERTVDVLFSLDSADLSARAGDLVRFTLEESLAAPGFWVTIDALTEGPRGLWTVYVLEPMAAPVGSTHSATHTVERRLVELIHLEGKRAFVRGDVSGGDRYIDSGLHRIVPGQPVRLADTDSTSVARSSASKEVLP